MDLHSLVPIYIFLVDSLSVIYLLVSSAYSVLPKYIFGIFSVFESIFLLMLYNFIFLFLQHLDRKGVTFCTRTTYDDNAITNAIEIYDSLR